MHNFYRKHLHIINNCEHLVIDEGAARLVQGRVDYEGRVEVYLKGRWGTVCHDHWQITDAIVACKQAGFPYGATEAVGGSVFGRGMGQIWLDDLHCEGNETSLFNCDKGRPTGQHSCGHTSDAGARCIPVR